MTSVHQVRKGKPPDLDPDHDRKTNYRQKVRLQPLIIDRLPSPRALEAKELQRLLSIISLPPSPTAHRLSSSSEDEVKDVSRPRRCVQWPQPRTCSNKHESGSNQRQMVESRALEQFSLTYQSERNFTNHPNEKYFAQIFATLVTQRLNDVEWMETAAPESILQILVCLRVMMRDANYQSHFFSLGGVKILSKYLQKATESYLTFSYTSVIVYILKEMTNIFQKLSAVVEQRAGLVTCGSYKALVLLLSANDVIVLHCTLHALIGLAQSPEPLALIAELNSIEILLRILQDYDTLSKKLAANLLRLLCADSQARETIKVYDGIPLLLSLLHSDSVTLLWNVVWCLVQLSEDQDTSNDIRLMGGLPPLLSLLHDRKFVSDRTAANMAAINSALTQSPAMVAEEDIWNFLSKDTKDGPTQNEEMKEHQLSLKSACCAALTELVVNDTNAHQVVQSNGIYSLGLLILPSKTSTDRERKATDTLQANAFRALRFVFSKERHRRLFKRLFPPALFEMFIDIGHYKRDIAAYTPLVRLINDLNDDALEEVQEGLKALNQLRAPSHFIQDYAVLELLGTGGFGSVFKVKKASAGQSYLALKEINTKSPNLGKSSKEKEANLGEMMSELAIIREQLRHPNIVRYYKTFVQNERLYIVMELIEGAPLGEHFNSLREKGERFSEDRIWDIFIQIVLALRYLHKDKGIVHRDLTPNNIMLGENDKVTITDFGLAKQKEQDCSKMTSVVGTILYSCPEIVQHQPYGEKADVWAIGCILYQMCRLQPPFYSSNMLSLVTKIVEADYEPLTEGEYSPRVADTIRRCITADPEQRADVVGVAGSIADLLLIHVDNVKREHINMEKKLERERRRTQKHFFEANQNMQNYHRLFLVSQERYDKLVNLASSGGGQSMKQQELEAEMQEGVFTELEQGVKLRRYHSLQTDTDDTNGWASDDEFGCSSGSESRESSAGHSYRASPLEGAVVPRPPEQGTPRSRRKPRHVDQSPLSQALTLDIPTKTSRDSGISSGDPSPNTSSPPSAGSSGEGGQRVSSGDSERAPGSADSGRTAGSGDSGRAPGSADSGRTAGSGDSGRAPGSADSGRTAGSGDSGRAPGSADSGRTAGSGDRTPERRDGQREARRDRRPNSFTAMQRSSSSNAIDAMLRRASSGGRSRPNSAGKGTLTISPRKVRPISDPILQMLHALHKIIFITQLPPTLSHNPRRRIIERFKRALFVQQSTSSNLKNELKKLLSGSRELIDLNFGPSEVEGLVRQASRDSQSAAVYDTEGEQVGVTYEQLHSILESVLVESGYYDMSHARATAAANPLAPIGALDIFNSRHASLGSA